MSMRLWVSVSDIVCTASAHLLCCTLGVLGLRVVVTIIDGDGGSAGSCQHRC